MQRSTIYAWVDYALRKIRETSEVKRATCKVYHLRLLLDMQIKKVVIVILIQSFAIEHLMTPLGEPIKERKNKTAAELWIEKFYNKFAGANPSCACWKARIVLGCKYYYLVLLILSFLACYLAVL